MNPLLTIIAGIIAPSDIEGLNKALQEKNYIAIRNSQINYYKDVGLYYIEGGSFVLYKPPGKSLADLRLKEERHPPELYYQRKDRITAIKELQAGFNQHIFRSIKTGNVVAVKSTLCQLVEETLKEPRSGTLQALPKTVDMLVSGYSKNPEIVKTIATISYKDYSTVIHACKKVEKMLEEDEAFAAKVGQIEAQLVNR